MARDTLTYRADRRNEWRAMPAATRPAWADFNRQQTKYHIGSARRPGRFNMTPNGIDWRFYGDSTKERARHVGKPDGAMHGQ